MAQPVDIRGERHNTIMRATSWATRPKQPSAHLQILEKLTVGETLGDA